MTTSPSKECGSCSLCCKILGIEELKKKPNTWCDHARPGCKIYADRPLSCREFKCLWLMSPNSPDEHRPDKIHAFWAHMESANPDIPPEQRPKGELISLYVDLGYPLAHTEEPILSMAKELQRRGYRVLAICGNKGWARLGNGWIAVKMIARGNEYSGYYDAVL